MKIIYKQLQGFLNLDGFAVENCHLKLLNGIDIKKVTKKQHHHTFYEVHFLVSGWQRYNLNNVDYTIQKGEFLLIPPGIKHSFVDMHPQSQKFSLCFFISEDLSVSVHDIHCDKIPVRILDNIGCIQEESDTRRFFSAQLIENHVLEIVMLLMRMCGMGKPAEVNDTEHGDFRLNMAKKFIKDNIEFNLKVADVAAFCHLGTKQLTRLFRLYENTTPLIFMQKQKLEHIENLLQESELSIFEISEKMNFCSEYHFHYFFKKYAGMPPGEYRKMTK